MEVTRSNFDAAFELIKSEINNTDFISIDAEFSGLSTIKSNSGSCSNLEEKYNMLKDGSNKLLLIQYGISLFKWSEKKKSYKAMPFNFYICPRPYKKVHNDVIFVCQSSSIDFLAKNGFDFNKLFHQGVSFMSPWEEEKAREKLKKEINFIAHNELHRRTLIQTTTNVSDDVEKKSSVFIPRDQRDFINSVCENIEKFMKDDSLKTYDLPPCSPFQRTLLYEYLEEKYPRGLYLKSVVNENNEKIIRGVKITKNEEIFNKRIAEENLLLDEIIGFTKVIRLLSDCRKPLIGHNMLMDLFLTTTNFFSLPPENLSEFKVLLISLFSSIFDTKLLCSMQPLSSKVGGTSLEKLKTFVDDNRLPNPEVKLSNKLNNHSKSKNEYHQAGYDAYCTGLVFISLLRCLADQVGSKLERIDFSWNLLKPFENRIFIWGIKDTQYMELHHSSLCCIAKSDNKKRSQSIFDSSNKLPSKKKKLTEVEDGEISSDSDFEENNSSKMFEQPSIW
ncbi:poly(A)-specific ribonuclease PARN [Hydra vulgaris]|uniref:Poly(A)-specific ribonuclease PARN n=1 Tax=Hydra vulgaris TaxID=6087 RepID=T2MHQ0_HYDVU|nr:poly(A)-specific ribonuclease PARN [Hydra vulgaris]